MATSEGNRVWGPGGQASERDFREEDSMAVGFLIGIVLAVVVILAIRQIVKKARRGGGCCPEREETVRRVPVADRNRKHYPYQVRMQIGGMTCENCARRVENALNSLDNVWAEVRISDHTAVVRLKQEPDVRELSRKVTEAGYAVTRIL